MAARREGLKDAALLLVRCAGFMLFYLHGLDKVKGAYGHFAHGEEWKFSGFLSNMGLPMVTLLALFATFAEGVASLAMGAGLWTRYAACVIAASMTGAIYTHVKTNTNPELALLYWGAALLFIFIDPGRFALDNWRRGGRR